MKERMKIQIKWFYCIFSALFSLMLVFSMHVFYDPEGMGTVDNVYFKDLHIVDLFVWIILFTLIYVVISFLPKVRKEMFFGAKREGKCIAQFFITFFVMVVCYFPYVASFWPGGVYSDTMGSIEIALGLEKMTSHEPIGYTLLWMIMYKIAGGSLNPGDYGAMYLFTVVQTLAMILLLSFFVNWLYRRGLKKLVCVAIQCH